MGERSTKKQLIMTFLKTNECIHKYKITKVIFSIGILKYKSNVNPIFQKLLVILPGRSIISRLLSYISLRDIFLISL